MDYIQDTKNTLVPVKSYIGEIQNKDGSEIRGTGRKYLRSCRMANRAMVSDWGYAMLGDGQTLEIIKSAKDPEIH